MPEGYNPCRLCPRQCSVDRTARHGFCGAGDRVRVAASLPHLWEEPCISGSRGSGTVFFSGCSLGCTFCQNEEFSHSMRGREISAAQLADIFLGLQDKGVHNINLVTPTHFSPTVIEALEIAGDRLNIPVVYNTSGYELVGVIEKISRYADIFLTDLKYFSPALSKKYSSAPDYFEYARPALLKMLELTGAAEYGADGIMKRGVIIRHLMLPGCLEDTKAVLDSIAEALAPYGESYAAVSLMSQFTPTPGCERFPEINRRVTSLEYQRAVEYMEKLGLRGYIQERSSAAEGYVPAVTSED